ncbi:MAG: pyridoxamine 5'-phosphate oxidase [Micromonosporaceae bacterium]
MSDNLPPLSTLREEYDSDRVLTEGDLAGDWVTQFGAWLADAIAAGVPEPNAMTLATADARGRPSARTVLLKRYDARGFVCFTNLRSRKATEALSNPYASLVFAWTPLRRQVVVCGGVETVARPEVEEYFATRPRGSQLSAWASPQSQVISSRAELEAAFAAAAERFGDRVPAPPHWGGLRIVPETVEFWQGRRDRLHDRLRYRRVAGGEWVVERLAP